MTVAAVERGTRAPARQSRPDAAQAARARPQGSQARASRGPAGGQGQRGAQGRTGPAGQQRQQKQRGREAARRLTGAATREGPAVHNYQAIIAAEFVAAELLVALMPLATRQPQPTVSNPQSLSPYVITDLLRFVAIAIVYLILEGMAAGPRGLARFSAWFGFLILLGVGLSEASHIADLFKMLAGGDVAGVVLTGKQAPASKNPSPPTPPPLGQGQPPPHKTATA